MRYDSMPKIPGVQWKKKWRQIKRELSKLAGYKTSRKRNDHYIKNNNHTENIINNSHKKGWNT